MIETVTYRMGSHSSSDEAERYRDQEEYERWQQRDPIQRFQKYLSRRKLWTEEWQQEIEETFKNELNDAIKRAEAAGKPEMGSLFEDVYMNKTQQLRAQEAELMSLEGPEAEDIGEFPL